MGMFSWHFPFPVFESELLLYPEPWVSTTTPREPASVGTRFGPLEARLHFPGHCAVIKSVAYFLNQLSSLARRLCKSEEARRILT